MRYLESYGKGIKVPSSYLDYYNQINSQKQINKLAGKYKNKKIILYGAGIMSKILFENFDLSKLNIVKICDAKYPKNSDETFFSYPVISPEELKNEDYDIIFVNLKDYERIINNIKYRIIINTKNEDKHVVRLLKPTLDFIIKQILF